MSQSKNSAWWVLFASLFCAPLGACGGSDQQAAPAAAGGTTSTVDASTPSLGAGGTTAVGSTPSTGRGGTLQPQVDANTGLVTTDASVVIADAGASTPVAEAGNVVVVTVDAQSNVDATPEAATIVVQDSGSLPDVQIVDSGATEACKTGGKCTIDIAALQRGEALWPTNCAVLNQSCQCSAKGTAADFAAGKLTGTWTCTPSPVSMLAWDAGY